MFGIKIYGFFAYLYNMRSNIKKILREEVEDFKDKHDRKIISYLIKQGFKPNSNYIKVIKFLDSNFGITGLDAFEMFQLLRDNFKNIETGDELIRKDISKLRLRSANYKARDLVQNKIPFKANNTDGEYIGDTYIVSSYGWYPIFIYKDGRWYENKDKYSVSTSKQTSQLRPFGEDIMKVSTDTLRKLIRKS